MLVGIGLLLCVFHLEGVDVCSALQMLHLRALPCWR